jgi:beta-lactamase superfamily II metal-dependent hydrolase
MEISGKYQENIKEYKENINKEKTKINIRIKLILELKGENMNKQTKTILIIVCIALIISIPIAATQLGTISITANGIEFLSPQAHSIEYKDLLNKTELHFIDVGQGDSTLIILPNNQTMLIDAGKSNYGYTVVNYLKNLKISKIDYLVMTHPDADHIGGINAVINNFKIDKIYMTNKTSTTKTFEDILLNMESKGLTFSTLNSGDNIIIGNDFNVTVLSPVKQYSDSNEMSIVIKLIYKNDSFLLMGDAGTEAEYDILSNNQNVSANLIKIGHHGSKYSSSYYFLEKVNPQYAIISAGKNNQYGHPSTEILNRLNVLNIKIYRTDINGNIIAVSNGNKINITVSNEI